VGCQIIYTLNALTLLAAHDDPAYAAVLARADLAVADGVGCQWAVRRLTGRKPERITGLELIDSLCGLCTAEGQSVFLLGAKPGVAARAALGLQQRFPGLRVAGTHCGFWTAAEEERIVEEINHTAADLLLVGLGQPGQEMFLDRRRESLAARVAVGVGGSFDVLAGHLRRAPRWMGRIGLEWLFRLLQEPWRLPRVLRLFRFAWLILWRRRPRTAPAQR